MGLSMKYVTFIVIIPLIIIYTLWSQNVIFPWLQNEEGNTLTSIAEIPVPKGYTRVTSESHTFASWLRNLPYNSIDK